MQAWQPSALCAWLDRQLSCWVSVLGAGSRAGRASFVWLGAQKGCCTAHLASWEPQTATHGCPPLPRHRPQLPSPTSRNLPDASMLQTRLA